jgi:hypothetical protein
MTNLDALMDLGTDHTATTCLACGANPQVISRGGSGPTRATSSGTSAGCGLVSEFVLAPPWALILT